MQKLPLFALIACAILLSGCLSTVPQSKYDTLAQECAQQKTDSASALDEMTSKMIDFKSQFDECAAARQATEKLLSDQQAQIASLKNDSEVLASARQKTDLIAKYKLAQQYFDDAYGPGNTPTTFKLKQIESLTISLNDARLYGSWIDFSRCTLYFECQNASSRFSANINDSINTLTYQVADIVAKK
jgi:outer membrane murein-binding lipoprotein Lpp